MNSLAFLNPLLLAGGLLALIPVLIHLFDRRKLPQQLLPTLRFLQSMNEQVKRRIRLRDALLLALRVLALLLLALLVARPVWQNTAPSGSAAAGPGMRDVIFIVDTSFGMRYRISGETLIDTARKRISDDAKALRIGEEAAVLSCDDRWQLLSNNFEPGEAALGAAKKAQAGDFETQWAECLRGAISVAAKSRVASVEIRLYTNLAAAGWDRGELPAAPQDKKLTLTVIDVAGQDLPNRAVNGLELAHTFGNSGEEWAASTEAANYGPAAASVGVRIEAEGNRDLAQGLIDFPTDGVQRKTLQIKPGGAEMARGFARLDADNLTDDDRRPFQFYFGKPVNVLIVDGAPGTFAEESESFYPLTALRPGRTQSLVEPKVLSRTDLSPADFKGMQVAMLLNVAELSSNSSAALESFVRSGGGLFWAMGDRTTPEAYQRLGNLVPGKFRSLRDLRGEGKAAVSLKSFPSKHPIFQDLTLANLSSAEFRAYQQLEKIPASAKVLLEFADGSPALVESALGKGRILWFASTLDPGWGNLPYRPFYLPLLQQSVRYLADTLKPSTERAFLTGTRVDLLGILNGRAATVMTPDGHALSVDPRKSSGAVLAADTRTAGTYRVMIGTVSLPEADFTIVRAASASNLTRIAGDRLQAKLKQAGFGGEILGPGTGGGRKIDPILPLLGFLALVMFGEAWTARRGER